jgi:hypothetical protein
MSHLQLRRVLQEIEKDWEQEQEKLVELDG